MSEIDPKLSRLYREASTEGPSAAVDATILAAARRQASALRRPARASWSRWMAPASALATLAVAVSLAYLTERERPLTSDDTTLRQLAQPAQIAPATRIAESTEAKVKAADSLVPAAKKEASAAATPEQTPAAKRSEPAPAATLPAQAGASSVPAPAPQAPASSATAFPAERRAKSAEPSVERESNVARDAAAGRLEAGAPAAPAAAAGPAPLRQQSMQRAPEAWLDDIARLKRDGRDKEAAEQLAQFRMAHPAYAVPESLRDLTK